MTLVRREQRRKSGNVVVIVIQSPQSEEVGVDGWVNKTSGLCSLLTFCFQQSLFVSFNHDHHLPPGPFRLFRWSLCQIIDDRVTKSPRSTNIISLHHVYSWRVRCAPIGQRHVECRAQHPFIFPTPYICRDGLLSDRYRLIWTWRSLN